VPSPDVDGYKNNKQDYKLARPIAWPCHLIRLGLVSIDFCEVNARIKTVPPGNRASP